MKRVFIAITLLLTCNILLAQNPKKKDTKIIVTPVDTTDLLTKVTLALFKQGYQPDYKDEKAGIIITKVKEFNTYNVKINILVVSSTITITGQANFFNFITGKKDTTFEDIRYSGMKGSDMMLSWNELDKLAKSFGPVRYSK